ncbi:MAG: ABC transporter substrate-binding protein [Chloroflexota bacterium]
MKRSLSLFAVLLMTSLLVILPVSAQEANFTNECVAEYDPDVDYFPEKVEITDAENFAVEYFNNYKVVTVTDAFDGADPFTYVLVQCGTPAPETEEFPDETQFLEVPTGDFIAMSTTQLPHLTDLDLLDKLVGLDSALFVSSPEVVELIEAGELVEVGSGSDVNIELVLETEPDIVMTYGFDPASDAHPILIEAGIFTALNSEWRESTPLARAEWIKYTALFYNAEAAATETYDDISSAYEEVRELAASVPEDERPTVLWNTFSIFSEAWLIPGPETYAGVLTQDAGGQIALGEEAPDGSAFLGFEPVYDGALEADVWITNLFGVTTLEGLLAQDERYADFSAVQEGTVWNNSLDTNENGGNNYFELGVTNPHLILQDLVAIFHPELLPEHEFNFFQPLVSSEE